MTTIKVNRRGKPAAVFLFSQSSTLCEKVKKMALKTGLVFVEFYPLCIKQRRNPVFRVPSLFDGI